jgi:para-aminobenzoate synthetase component 1
VTRGQESIIETSHSLETSNDDPFELLKRLQSDTLPEVLYDGELPFVGGALGYFSYDLGRRVELIPELAERDISAPEMAVGIFDWALIVDHHKKTAYLVGSEVESNWQWLSTQTAGDVRPFTLVNNWQSNMSKENYQSKFERVKDYIQAGDCYQINLAQRFNAPYQGSEWEAFQKLSYVNGGPFSAFIRIPDCAILSVSPERFLQVKNRKIETKPIKGTRPRSHDKSIDKQAAVELSQAEKDQAENLMIVDLLRNDVGRVATPGSVQVPKLFEIESFPAVHHLVSTITAKLDENYTPVDLLKVSFPGGSITGAPKIRAMEIIEELEPHRRSAYCGSIGYISRHGNMDTSITIRTLVAEKNNLFVWAGGGLVSDSECLNEYQETLDKLSRILPILTKAQC